MVMTLHAIRRGDDRGFRIWVLGTALLGAVFLGFQVFEFREFYVHYGLSPATNLFGSSFFILTGFHGAHVTGGVIWLVSLFGQSLNGTLTQKDSLRVELAGLYWHFVDIVWIIIFTLVYLLGANDGPVGDAGHALLSGGVTQFPLV